MAERIPHLSALRVFEAAARHLSFQRAADELGLSPSAVSHQIRTLEAYLDAKLFERRTRAVALTAAGRALRPGCEEGFRRIEGAVREVRGLKARAVLVVTTGPSIASKWLAGRLYRFEEAHPSVEVRLAISNRRADLHAEDVDVAIRHGAGVYKGLESERIFGEAHAPLAAPSLGLERLDDLRDMRLLHDDSAQLPGPAPDWSDWLAAAGLDAGLAAEGRRFSQTDHALQAAIDGVGVVLGRISIAAPDILSGRLAAPFGPLLPSPYGYFFVTRPGRRRERAIAAFRDWLRAEAAAQMTALGDLAPR